MNEVRLGVLQAGAEIFSDDNSNLVLRGFAREVETNALIPVFVKIMDLQKIFIECICAIIGRRIGIPIPKPYLIKIDKKSKVSIENSTLITIAFGSEDAKFPSMRRSIYDKTIIEKFCRSNLSILVGLFDEWIVNEDRNIGNILYGGAKSYWFIDHESARLLESEPELLSDENYVLELLSHRLTDKLKAFAREKAAKECEYISSKVLDDIRKEEFAQACVDTEVVDVALSFLSERVMHLQEFIEERLIATQLELGI